MGAARSGLWSRAVDFEKGGGFVERGHLRIYKTSTDLGNNDTYVSCVRQRLSRGKVISKPLQPDDSAVDW